MDEISNRWVHKLATTDTIYFNDPLEDFELQEGDIDKPIEKVCLLIYADTAICHACTNAIPKMQNLLSTKFHNLGVEIRAKS